MKNKLFYYFSIAFIFLVLNLPAQAQVFTASENNVNLENAFGNMLTDTGTSAGFKVGNNNLFSEILSGVIFTILSLLGTIFLIMLVYAGIRWMTAGGREEVLSKAKDTIKQAIIGLLVVAGAYAISYFFFLFNSFFI